MIFNVKISLPVWNTAMDCLLSQYPFLLNIPKKIQERRTGAKIAFIKIDTNSSPRKGEIKNGGKTMKRRPKKAMGTAACATLAAVMLLTMGAWSAFAGGLLATGKTVAENEAVWGKPVAIQTFSDGTEKRFYKINNTMNINYRSFTYKDGRVMNEGNINESIPEAPAQPAQYKVVIF